MLREKKCFKSKDIVGFVKMNSLLNEFVKLKTYMSTEPIYGEIVDFTQDTLTVLPNYADSSVDYDKQLTYLLPKKSIISISKL